MAIIRCLRHATKPAEGSKHSNNNTVRIWGKYVYTTSATTKAAVSPITTNLKHLMMEILAETYSVF
jgi:hypothetical protein